jgi:putative nucleotidyltransferase with HDIG domain
MKMLPYDGPMADWPEVAAIEGAAEMLQRLNGQYPLILGTNALDSKRETIRAALDRVGLGQYLTEIYTFQQLGFRKPELGFFRGLERALGCAPHELLMVGDEYRNDMIGAWRAGWKTAWLNASHRMAPGLMPVHTLDLAGLSELPEALERLKHPDTQTCLSWHLEAGAPRNVLQHVQMVAAVAYRMALWLRAAGAEVDPLLAYQGGLVHDLAKLVEREDGPDHGLLAAEMLRQRGAERLAQIASRHMLFNLLDDTRRPRAWEDKLVYLADKVVEGQQVVTVERRLERLKERYAIDAGLLAALAPRLTGLQDEVCAALNLTPAALTANLQAAMKEVAHVAA